MVSVRFYKLKNISHPLPIFAWAIMLFQRMLPWKKDSYSHMAFKVGDNVYDSRFDGTQCTSVADFMELYKVIDSRDILIQGPEEIDIHNWFKANHQGKSYDWSQIFGLILRNLRITKRNNLGRNNEKLICNELLIDLLVRFEMIEPVDTDNYDLLDTWELIKDIKHSSIKK